MKKIFISYISSTSYVDMVFELDEVCCFTLSTDQDITSDVHWNIGHGYEFFAD